MNLNNLKIGTQLKLGFAALMLCISVLSIVSYVQSNAIHQQLEEMYDHPFTIRQALGTLRSEILTIQSDIKDVLFAMEGDQKEIDFHIRDIALSKDDAFAQIDILSKQFLGPRVYIDSLKQEFIKLIALQEEIFDLRLQGKKQEAIDLSRDLGALGKRSDALLSALQKVDDFAKNKAYSFYVNSNSLNDSLNNRLILIVVFIVLLSIPFYFILLRNIRNPIVELTTVARRFHNGEMDARSSYRSQNEFGVLSDSFNNLTKYIQNSMDLNKKAANINGLMISEDDPKKFFIITLAALAEYSGSQLAAVYLLSDDKKHFEHFESIGADDNSKKSFAADSFEGEFGATIYSHTIQHIKTIPEDTRFVFHTVSGKFIPREIMTIPILAGKEVIAVISLASIGMYSEQAIHLVNNILVTMSARIEGVLAYRKNVGFLKRLEMQNGELEAQTMEMASQAAELMEQNTELEMQKKQLNEASQLKTNFLSNMSHELRTPLNSVIALSGVLNRRLANQIPDEEYSYLEVIERNGKHLLALINDILDIARIESGREETEITSFNANNLIAEVVSMLHPQAHQKNIQLVHAVGNTDIVMTNDANKTLHILQNVISNAVKFTESGIIEVKAFQSDKNIIITITDTGIGIAVEHIPHIFDEFRQADGSTSRRFGGSGLGLAIAKKYANLLGGKITVKSTFGKGSEFTITLPVVYEHKNRIAEQQETANFKYPIKKTPIIPASDKSLKTILLVDDSEPAIIQMKDILEESGYQTLIARDGAEALGIISHTTPDAMVLDLMMPDIDGFEVLKTLRNAEETADIPVLILTAKHITKEELNFLKRNNVHELIQKGDVNRNELLNAIATMVNPKTIETVMPKPKLQIIKGKPVVMVVEDNPDNMITIKALLADNYIVIEAGDGYAGIEMAKKHNPNLILMDIALPGMDGIEAFKQIRKNPLLEHIPVFAITASAMLHDREAILAHGFDVYIAKPIDEKLFYKKIKEVLYGA